MGPAGPMPAHFSGWITRAAAIRFGSNFTVTHLTVGSYRISIAPTPSGHALIPVATPATAMLFPRIVAYTLNADGSHTIDIEIRNVAGTLIDSDFTFVAMEAE